MEKENLAKRTDKFSKIYIWENKRKHKKNIIIWLTEVDYVIVIRKNPNEKLLWTAYPITHDHTKRKMQKE